ETKDKYRNKFEEISSDEEEDSAKGNSSDEKEEGEKSDSSEVIIKPIKTYNIP
ncbi:9688_t:CDS:1, partial [Racocetra persica]